MKGAKITDYNPGAILAHKVSANDTELKVLHELFALIDRIIDHSVSAIGIGVPSVVDVNRGIVYDVQNIPSWKAVPLRKHLEDRYGVPVLINNDANCFALGEKYFGKAKDADSFVGLAIGTGLGAGIVINGKLYAGENCGAGEFGMIEYLDSYYENYASGQFFIKSFNEDGAVLSERARSGDKEALQCFKEFGTHMGNAIKTILYSCDPQMIVLGGSIRYGYDFFQETMWRQIRTFAYQNSLKNFRIEISDLKNSGILGAAALCYDGGVIMV